MLIMQISLGPEEWRDDGGRGGARVETFEVSIWPSTLPSPSPISPDCAAAPPPPPPPFSLHKVFFEPDHPFISHQLPPTRRFCPEVSDTLPPLLSLLPSFFEGDGALLAGYAVPANPSGNGAISHWLGFVRFAKK